MQQSHTLQREWEPTALTKRPSSLWIRYAGVSDSCGRAGTSSRSPSSSSEPGSEELMSDELNSRVTDTVCR